MQSDTTEIEHQTEADASPPAPRETSAARYVTVGYIRRSASHERGFGELHMSKVLVATR
jgi:hypothetical protein